MDFLITDELKDLGRVKMTPEQKELLKYFRPYDKPVSPPTTPPPVHRMEIDDDSKSNRTTSKRIN